MNDKCEKCGKENFLSICSRACDKNYYQWNDKQEIEGYLPSFGGISDGDGCSFKICVECGWIDGLDLKSLKDELDEIYSEIKN